MAAAPLTTMAMVMAMAMVTAMTVMAKTMESSTVMRMQIEGRWEEAEAHWQLAEGATKRTTVRQQQQCIGYRRCRNYVTIDLPAKDERRQLTMGG
jgi:hypothetical protein